MQLLYSGFVDTLVGCDSVAAVGKHSYWLLPWPRNLAGQYFACPDSPCHCALNRRIANVEGVADVCEGTVMHEEIEMDEVVDVVVAVADERTAVHQRDEKSEVTAEAGEAAHPSSEMAENIRTANSAVHLQRHSPCWKTGAVVAFALGVFAVVHFELATE